MNHQQQTCRILQNEMTDIRKVRTNHDKKRLKLERSSVDVNQTGFNLNSSEKTMHYDEELDNYLKEKNIKE